VRAVFGLEVSRLARSNADLARLLELARLTDTLVIDADGHRLTAFATNTPPGGPHRQLADLELRHSRRARVEDRIRAGKDTLRHEAPCRIPGPAGRNLEGGFWV